MNAPVTGKERSRSSPRPFRRSASRPLRAALVVVAASVAGGCRWIATGSPAPFRVTPRAAVIPTGSCDSACTDSVDVVATGVGGFLILPWRDSAQLVLTPPSITNPSLLHLALADWWRGTRPDRARIARRLRTLPGADSARLGRVAAVLVGHGHYDHLMDLPPLLPWMPHATVYGSSTVSNLLAPVTSARRAVVPGDRIEIGRVMTAHPLAWAHAPNIGTWTIAAGDQSTPRASLPRSVLGWKMGPPLAWAVDVRDVHGAVAVRLVLHDAAASREVVLRAVAAIAQLPAARTTVAVLTAANYDQAAGYPEVLLATLQPDHVLFGHWEDFFRSPDRPLRIVRGIRGQALVEVVERFQQSRWSVLEPGATLRVRSAPALRSPPSRPTSPPRTPPPG